jgi:hypothetical protein
MESASYDGFFSTFRLAYLIAGLVAALLLWRRPSPRAALWVVIAVHLAAWAAYTAPLGRLYALNELSDIAFNVGSAACAAATGNPFDHTQVGFAHLEPFWSAAFAVLSLGQPERVLPLYAWLSPFTIVFIALGLYLGLRTEDDDADRWERVLVVFAVLGLSSWSTTQPVPALWAGNFLLKPNHAAAWGLAGVALGLAARRGRVWVQGLVLGVMAWVFILDWAFLIPGLILGAWLRRDERWAESKRIALAIALSIVVAVPYILHLTRDHNPMAEGGTPEQIWLDPLGQRLRSLDGVTIDLGPLLVLAVAGAVVCAIRRTPRDAFLLGTFVALWVAWAAYQVTAVFGLTPEADEHHYFLRVALALTAGVALAAFARRLDERRGWRAGRGAALVLGACWPLTFPAYWNPPDMDRYFRFNLDPIPARAQTYCRWVRENTPRRAVFLAGRQPATWIPILAGRRILLAADARPPADYAARKEAEHVLLLSRDAKRIRETAQRFQITHVAIDQSMIDEYGEETLKGLGKLSVYEPAYHDHSVRILAVRP